MISKPEQVSSQGPIVSFDKVSMRYGRGNEIFSDVSFDLKPKSFTFLTGASGAGKSTLLKLIYLALRPSRGLIRVFGTDALSSDRKAMQLLKRRIGVVSQDFSLISHLSVYENAVLPLIAAGQDTKKLAADARELLAWVGLGDKLHSLPPTLSGGEAQRLAIARAVINRPSLLIADEPTGNVDPAMGGKLMRLFQEMNRTGTTIVIATHDASLIKAYPCDCLKIVDGQLSQGSAL